MDTTTPRQYKIAIGICILRPVDFTAKGKKEIRGFEPAQITDRGTYMMRVNHAVNVKDPDTLWAYSPEGHGVDGKPVQRVGMIVFLKEPLLPEWTHIEITGISKSGNAVFGRPIYGSMQELLDKYEMLSGPTKK